jgi:DNA polymerase III epsilon subunit-like protein
MRVIGFDTETTDLISNSLIGDRYKPHIIEFYAVAYEVTQHASGLQIEKADELEFYCKPGVEISEEVTRITGIKPEDVADALPFREHAELVKRFIGTGDEIVAHNLSYDMAVVNIEMGRQKMDMAWPGVLTCTVEATEHLKGHRLSLSNLHLHLFEEAFTGAHRARNDVEAMMRCYFELLNRGEI